MDSHPDVAALFLEYSDNKLEQMEDYLASCLNRLSDEQVWQRGGEHENAVGNIVLHLCGNMRQWIMFGVGRQPDVRVRELEFSTRGGMTRDDLLALFRGTVREARGVLADVSAERLTQTTNPQRGETSVLGAIYQVVGHVQQHVGQIILLTKQMTSADLDLTIPRPR
jgi:uncharacterized damage-inducible protein DinB